MVEGLAYIKPQEPVQSYHGYPAERALQADAEHLGYRRRLMYIAGLVAVVLLSVFVGACLTISR